jgi:hypothetical protein
MKRALAMVGLALIFVPSGSAVESTIYPGVGIGKVKLGMTKGQVEKLLGTDALVDDRGAVAGHSYLELGWNFDSRSVRFLLQSGRYRAVRIGTTQASQRTSDGVGPGAHWLKVAKAYPHALCSFLWTSPYGPELLVPHQGGTQLLLTFRDWPKGFYASFATYAVTEVVVRTRYQPLPEFAPGYEHRCLDGWQTTAKPRSQP